MNIVTALVFSLLLFCSPSYAQEKVYDLDTQQSVVSWKGEKLTGSHHGTLKVNHGKVRFSDEGLTGGTFTLDMTSITNLDIESDQWRAKLEKHLKSDDFFDVSHFPEGTFVITKVHPQDDGYEVVGDLTIKGKTHPISFPATVTKEGDSYHASAKITLDRLKWDIKYNSGKFFDPQKLGDKLIYDEIEIGLELWTKGAQ
ncbi:MAG: YceI family protein [Bdellovibrionales bacterium]|nr:YceI family protein [Bdellovibrionales bacterium]